MANSKSPKEEWKDDIDFMTYEELQRCITDSSYYPEYLEYARSRLAQLENDMAHVYEVFIKTLKKRRIKYELGDEKDIFYFIYNRKRFRAELDCEYDFVTIHFLHDIFINKEDGAKLSRLGKTVNEANKICRVNTIYEENEEEGYFFVLSSATIHFISENPNFEMEFKMALESCLTARYVINGLMKRRNKRLDG
jgi:histidinol phosphatase-like PHP family hydrolase